MINKLLFFITILLSILNFKTLSAENITFLDFKYVLNNSVAGKKAQDYLKNKLQKGIEQLKKKEAKILDEEKKIIQQKKVLSPEEYKKQITSLRSKVSSLQKERQKIVETVARERAFAKNELLNNLNPLLIEYMSTNNIKMVIDKKNLIRADQSLDITKEIVSQLNKKIKSINFK